MESVVSDWGAPQPKEVSQPACGVPHRVRQDTDTATALPRAHMSSPLPATLGGQYQAGLKSKAPGEERGRAE